MRAGRRVGVDFAFLACVACSRVSTNRHGDGASGEGARTRAPQRIAPLSEPIVTGEDAGQPAAARWPPGVVPHVPGTKRRRLARLAYVTDSHVVDDESPARVVDLDDGPPFQGARRPQEAYACRVLDAAVRTLNRMDHDDPFDALVFGGDAIDNAQSNELDWFLGILAGKDALACDSGDADDPVPGPGNDPKDPFVPEGLDANLGARWYWVMGNHDILSQGSFPCDAMAQARSLGTHASGGTIMWRDGRASVTHDVTADPRRARVTPASLLARLGPHAPSRDGTKASYTVDLAGSPVRLIVVDTVARSGGAAAVVLREDVDGFVAPELRRAATEGKWVVVAAHHASDRFDDGTAFNGHPVEGAVRETEWDELLASSGVVAVSLVGHGHTNRVRRLGREPRAVWELQSSALADDPGEFRVIELWDEDGGWATVRATLVAERLEGNPVAADARHLATLDFTSGQSCCGPGPREDGDVVLWARRPFRTAGP